jgi:hypothetical protein
MILQRVLDVLAAKQVAGPETIAAAIGSSPEAVRSMLATLQRRGLVQRYSPLGGCDSGCKQCDQGAGEWYRLTPVGKGPGDAGGGCPAS